MHQHETVVEDTPVDRAIARLIDKLASSVFACIITTDEAELILDDMRPKYVQKYQECLKADVCDCADCPFKE